MNDPRDRTINNQYIQSEPHGTQYLGIGSLSPPLMSEAKRAEKNELLIGRCGVWIMSSDIYARFTFGSEGVVILL